MTPVGDRNGPRLRAYLAPFWTNEGMSETAWCVAHGLDPSLLSRLKSTREPTFDLCRKIADATDIPISGLLVAAGLVEPNELDLPAAEPPAPVSIEHAISHDPSLTDANRTALRAVLEALRGEGTTRTRTQFRGR